MGYGSDGLTFNTLRGANLRRLPEFKNANGELSHTREDGFDWTPNDWMTALCGEVGELANLLKKVRRGEVDLHDPRISDELADIQCYLDLLAHRCGVDLGRATISKFNAVSKRVESRVYIGHDGDWHLRPSKTVREHCADMERERNHVIDDLKRTGLRKMCHQCGKWHDDSTRVTYTNTVPPGHTEPTPLGDVYMCVDCSPHNWIKPNTK